MIRKAVLYSAAAVAGILCAYLLSGIFMLAEMTGNGMEPSIEKGSCVLINKTAYDTSVPETGDVVALENRVYGEDGEGSILIRRVVGSRGDSIEIKDDMLYLNGSPYTEYMSEAVSMDDMDKMVLDENEIFVLADNRKASLDSRDEAVGIVDTEECIGRICFR